MQLKEKVKNKLIFTADDFGKCEVMDTAILKGYQSGVLTSTCIMANGANYTRAVEEIFPQCRDIGMGCHLNIIEGKSLLNKTKNSMLCDSSGYYNRGWLQMLAKSTDKKFMDEVEAEFRVQIEKTILQFEIDHINSHVHTHAIPAIFELTCRLAKEYNIPAIRTQAEKPYLTSVSKHLKMGAVSSGANAVKNALLNNFTAKNKEVAKEHGLKTNDYFIGLLYTGFMDKNTILKGLSALKQDEDTEFCAEVLVHPYLYETDEKADKNKLQEYLVTQDSSLIDQIVNLGFEPSRFSSIS